jgi:hypothetical protein
MEPPVTTQLPDMLPEASENFLRLGHEFIKIAFAWRKGNRVWLEDPERLVTSIVIGIARLNAYALEVRAHECEEMPNPVSAANSPEIF